MARYNKPAWRSERRYLNVESFVQNTHPV